MDSNRWVNIPRDAKGGLLECSDPRGAGEGPFLGESWSLFWAILGLGIFDEFSRQFGLEMAQLE